MEENNNKDLQTEETSLQTSEIKEDTSPEVEDLDKDMRDIYKKYKYTLYGIIACIALYLVCLFMLKNTVLTLVCCIPMIVLAFLNNKFAKQYRQLALKKAEIQKANNPAAQETVPGGSVAADPNSPIVANANSLNELPKEYTVLDQVDFNGYEIPHIIVSPYGIAAVSSDDIKADLGRMALDLGIENAPVYLYEPNDDISVLAEEIQMPKTAVLSEKDIYAILYRLTGIN